jgi:parallel beta-helix repeat protein
MVYTAFEWRVGEDGRTPISAYRLNQLEKGLEEISLAVTPPDGSRNGYANFLTDWHGVNDGLTDVSFGLNQALAAGGMLYLPPGDYLCSDQLVMQSLTKTILTGPGRIISMADDVALVVHNAPHIIDGVTILGAGAALNNQAGITIYADDAVLVNTTVSAVSGWAVNVGGRNVRMEDNNFDNCGLGTLSDRDRSASVYVTGDYVKVLNNTLTNSKAGIICDGVDYVSPIVGGLIQGNRLSCRESVPPTSCGISSRFAQYLRTVNNEIAGYPDNCIDEYGSQFTVIADNVIHDGQADGIRVGHEETRHITITGNDVVRCSVGIRAWDNAASVEISGNSVADCKFGILAFGAINSGELWLGNIRIENNNVTADGSQIGGYGIGVKNVDGFTIAQNTVINANHEGIYLDSCLIGMVRENTVRNASVDTTGTWAGIHALGTVTRVQVDDNILDSGCEVAVLIDGGATSIRIKGTRWSNIATGISNGGTGTVLTDNLEW